MVQDEADRLLRPRTASQAAPTCVVVSAGIHPAAASLSPETSTTSPIVTPTTPRRRLLKCLLLGGTLYASLLLFWSASHMGLLNAADRSRASSTFHAAVNAVFREAKELQLTSTESLLATTGIPEDRPEAQTATLVPPVRQEKTSHPPEEDLINDQASGLGPNEAIAQTEEHARSVKMLPPNG
ncbi:hypothetical protein PHYPSEUDO_010706 [Phytophthora pseudosyringae]|uniref:Transmembrane protein n=1 Tax=Phytophthora pseudosyringae TaxID=221518 RepID=A0A8T1VAL2_9STRA|nr:hypothetical protein PHYPSEUDO_010706 [Phytophthora pseudosyringae]